MVTLVTLVTSFEVPRGLLKSRVVFRRGTVSVTANNTERRNFTGDSGSLGNNKSVPCICEMIFPSRYNLRI